MLHVCRTFGFMFVLKLERTAGYENFAARFEIRSFLFARSVYGCTLLKVALRM